MNADKLNQLTAISPVDGRYSDVTEPLRDYFSEYAYLKRGIEIELKYFKFLSEVNIFRKLTRDEEKLINSVHKDFTPEKAQELKEKGTPDGLRIHDLKSIEHYIRYVFSESSLSDCGQWIHFGLTSYDIVDNSYRTLIQDAIYKVIIPEISSLKGQIESIAYKFLKLPMLGRTHGQPAIPTTFGKEMAVFSGRIDKELKNLRKTRLYGKFGGAVGNWNALKLAYPGKKWPELSTKFLKSLGLYHTKVTTQIAPNEDLIELFQNIFRINSILIAFDQDIWRYISDDWIVQKGKSKFVGSSTMPQKINPLEFENSEGNLIMANGLFETFSRKLPISRLQRDLSDSTVLRNIGVALAHSLVAYKSCQRGIETIEPNKTILSSHLNEDWSILSEALQTILRKNGMTDAYEKVAEEFRGKKLQKSDWIRVINKFEFAKSEKLKLAKLTPETYIGIVLK